MSNPTDQPLTMSAERACCAHLAVQYDPEKVGGDGSLRDRWTCKDCGHAFIPRGAHEYLLALLQSQFDNVRRDKEEGDRQNALILADYHVETREHNATRERLADREKQLEGVRQHFGYGTVGERDELRERCTELREALKDKQRGMTFTESERNAELVRQVAETRERLAEVMIKHSLATGHGDSVLDLLAALEIALVGQKIDRNKDHGNRLVRLNMMGAEMGALREQLAQAQELLKHFTHPNLYDSDHTRELEDAVYGALELLAALRAKPEPTGSDQPEDTDGQATK